MTWACGLILVLLIPRFPSVREIDFTGTNYIDIENELLPRAPGKHCGKEDAVNLQNLSLLSIPIHVIKSDKIRNVDLSFNKISNIPKSFFLDVPNIECLNLTANEYVLQDAFDSYRSYSLKTLVLDRIKCNNNYDYYRGYSRYEDDVSYIMTGYFPNLETLHLSNTKSCYIDASIETKFPRLATLYLKDYGSSIQFNKWQLPSNLRHLHAEGTSLIPLILNRASNLQSLYLDSFNYNRNFSIPSHIINLQVLSCRNCSLVTTDIQTFFESPRNALKLLDLSQNNIYNLPVSMFYQMNNLESLILSNNMFSTMPDVQALSRLRGLVLNYNRINEVVEIKSHSLEMLSLRGNGISQINATTFQGLPALELLDLSENGLASLPIGWVHNLKNIVTLNLKSNLFTRLSDTSLTTANSELRHLIMSVDPIDSFTEEDFKLLPNNCTIHIILRGENAGETAGETQVEMSNVYS